MSTTTRTLPDSPAKPLLETVLDELGQEIVNGKARVGLVFKLSDISDRFGISRTVARETMRALEQLGMVHSSRRVGITVQPPEKWNVLDTSITLWRLNDAKQRQAQLESLTELCIAIEPLAARGMALHASPDQAKHLKDLAAEMRKLGEAGKGESKRFIKADIAYHELILRTANNELFAALAPSISSIFEGYKKLGLQADKPDTESLKNYEKLAELIGAGDTDGAEKESRTIVTEVKNKLTSLNKD